MSFTGDGRYEVSLKNKLRDSVKNIHCLVIVCDTKGSPIDFDLLTYSGVIPGGLAKRVSAQVAASAEMLNTPEPRFPYRNPPMAATGRMEFRILYFEIVEGGGIGDK
jgi:hypothetical protein